MFVCFKAVNLIKRTSAIFFCSDEILDLMMELDKNHKWLLTLPRGRHSLTLHGLWLSTNHHLWGILTRNEPEFDQLQGLITSFQELQRTEERASTRGLQL